MRGDGSSDGGGPGPVESAKTPPLHPADVLAGRYRIEDLIGEVGGSQVWRATDEVLNRSVGVQVLTATDPRAAAFLNAARASTAVTDSRFLRVLDVAEDERGHAYVVSEWARAVSLASMLRAGPLDNRRAAMLVGEVAAAVDAAHEVGRTHRRLDPSTVFVKDSGAVRVAGLGTDYALLGAVEGGDGVGGLSGSGLSALGLAPRTPIGVVGAAEQEDVEALGRLLYACLVARWPGGREFGLPAAPSEHGRLLRPRQVRPGVSRDADTVCDRVLGRPPRHHESSLRSARDVASALALVGDDPASLSDDQPSLGGVEMDPYGSVHPAGAVPAVAPPALLPASRPERQAPVEVPPPVGASARSHGSTTGARKWVWTAVLLLLAVVSVIAYALGRATSDRPGVDSAPPTSSSSPPTSAPPDRPLPVVAATDFDPEGNGSENPELVAAAVDADPLTAWRTVEYYDDPRLAGLKRGVGLLLDLGQDRQVNQVLTRFEGEPTSYAVFATPAGTPQPPTSLAGLDRLGGQRGAGTDASLSLRDPVTTRYVVLWLTSLPAESDGVYVGIVDEVSVRGRSS